MDEAKNEYGDLIQFQTKDTEGLHSSPTGEILTTKQTTETPDQKRYWIRLANTPERQTMANVLVTRLYSGKGYVETTTSFSTSKEEPQPYIYGPQKPPETITLILQDATGTTIGTISVGLDLDNCLLADENYREELSILRQKGAVLCEFKKLAIDSGIKNKRVIACIFHTAMLYAFCIFGRRDCVFEVTPKHAKFYGRLFGATIIGPERLCPRVNTVGTLLYIDLSVAFKLAEEFGGLMDKAKDNRSLYPYFFSKEDAKGILGRLKIIDYQKEGFI